MNIREDSCLEILLIVNESPWASSLAGTAQRIFQAAQASGHKVTAVFFHQDGVYNAQDWRASDKGLTSPALRWQELCTDRK